MFDAQPDDRVLFLSITDLDLIARLAAQVSRGLAVGIGPDEQVREARLALRDADNVMFVPAPPEDIPWQDGFFSIAIDPVAGWSTPERVVRELARVLAPGARVYVPAGAANTLEQAGFHSASATSGALTRLLR